MDKELESHVEVVGRIQAITAAVGKENARVKEGLNAAGAIVHTAKQLQPLLAQAEAMQRTGGFMPERSTSIDPVVMANNAVKQHFIQGSSFERVAFAQRQAEFANDGVACVYGASCNKNLSPSFLAPSDDRNKFDCNVVGRSNHARARLADLTIPSDGYRDTFPGCRLWA